MKQLFRRGAALGLALVIATGAATASASQALGWELHTGQATLSQGTDFGKQIFWSDTYSDLRTEHYVTYTPNTAVTPTVTYGEKVLTRATLTAMAQTLESQGKRVVSGLNGDWYVLSTGAPTGLVVTNGVVRATPYYASAWAVGFRADGTAFIGQPALSASVTLAGWTLNLNGGVNKVRKLTAADGSGGLTLLTSDFSTGTQNTEAGMDVILTPVDDGMGTYSTQLAIGRQTLCTVEQVLESAGSIDIPEGKLVLTLNGRDNADQLALLRSLQPGDQVTVSISSPDERWNSAVQALGGVSKLVTGGQVASGLDPERTACTAVGIKADGTLLFYTMDGKQSGYSVGATLEQVARRLVELGCVEALSMDGGGSTTLGVTWPYQNAMGVVNSPSDGGQRANSTAIFLTTDLQPSGELASYFITPTDSMVLSGTTLTMSAVGLDTNYYATPGNPVTWTVSGGGTVDAAGRFTAGAESGFSQITATDGWASGTACVTTVQTPDSIRLTREDDGAAVTALNLDPGERVDLKATAVYRKIALVSQDPVFDWTVDLAVGTVDENGLFTAGGKAGSGSLTVSAGGCSVTIPVSVAGHVKILEDCEGDLFSFAATDTASFGAETSLDYVRCGEQSLRLNYDASSGAASLAGTLSIPAGEAYLGMWVYGDGSGNTLLATVTDQNLQSGQFLLTALDFTGWKHVSVALPEGAVAVTSLDVIYGGREGRQTGTIRLDQFTTSNEEMHDTTAPEIALTLSGTQLTASIRDDVDRIIPASAVLLTYDGGALPFDYDETAGKLKATLPAGDSGYHRVSVVAADASGNLGRASGDISPAGTREEVFTDMTSHWAARYAAYLYDAGVTNGVPGADGLQFQPDKEITRAEFFALVARWMKLDLTQFSGVALPFADTAAIPDWALGEVKAMYGLGLLKGASEGGVLKANASATISRAEALTILGRTQTKGYPEAELTFSDANLVPDWAASYVKSLTGQGVLSGADLLRPTEALTRGEMAKLLYAML